MRATGYTFTHVGGRDTNQDAFLADNERSIFAVADGVGGGVRGDDASKLAVAGLVAHTPTDRLKDTFEAIQRVIYNEAMESIGEPLMGTTLTAVALQGFRAELCHAGDSRCYLYADSVLRQLTEDHETFDENVQAPVLSSYLGIPADIHPLRIQQEMVPLKPGNRLLLCSDGLYKQVLENRITHLIRENFKDPQKLLEIMGAEAIKAEFSDNVTIVYVEIED